MLRPHLVRYGAPMGPKWCSDMSKIIFAMVRNHVREGQKPYWQGLGMVSQVGRNHVISIMVRWVFADVLNHVRSFQDCSQESRIASLRCGVVFVSVHIICPQGSKLWSQGPGIYTSRMSETLSFFFVLRTNARLCQP